MRHSRRDIQNVKNVHDMDALASTCSPGPGHEDARRQLDPEIRLSVRRGRSIRPGTPLASLRAVTRFDVCVVFVAGVAGCANVWGFKTVTSEASSDAGADGMPIDATTDDLSPFDARAPKPPGDDEPYAPTGVDEGSTRPDLEPSPDDASRGPSVPDGAERDAPTTDGANLAEADGAQNLSCRETCAGCCDARGQCQGGRSISVCGGVGIACADCSSTSCPLLYGPCCGGANGCGCQLLSLGLVQCQ